MKTGGSERKTAWGGGGPEEGGSVSTMLSFDFEAQSRSGAIGSMETTATMTVVNNKPLITTE